MNTYFKFLSKNKLYAAIEAFGLSVALGFIILLASYARTEFSVGARQPLSRQLYAVGMGNCVGMTYGTAEEFFPSVPEITSWTRMGVYGDADVIVNEDYYAAKAVCVDTNFLQLFDYRLSGCDRNCILSGRNDVILSEKFAHKAFGSSDPVGRSIEIGRDKFTVTGVIQDFGPYDEFEYYDIFLSIRQLDGKVQRMDNFGMVNTFVALQDGASPDAVAEKLLDKYLDYWKDFYTRDGSSGNFLWGSTLTRFDKLYFSKIDIYSPLRHGDKKIVEVLLAVALILLISAIFNYINLTVAQTGKRAKEMATRRLLGESSGSIVRRYLAESFIFTSVCALLGVLVALLFKGWMEKILSTEIILVQDAATIAAGIAVLVAVSVLSGLLPALMVSRFKPIAVVKGDFRFRSKMVFSKVFIVCQNIISTVLIAVALTMTLQMRHLVSLPVGYNTDLLSVKSFALGYNNMAAQEALHQRLQGLPQVETAAMAVQLPFSCGSNGVHIEGEGMSWLQMSSVDSTAFRLLGFRVIEQYSDPIAGTCWFTEEAKRRYGITAENRTVGTNKYGEPQYECCGIISDFRARDPLYKPMPDSHCAVRNYPDVCFCHLLKIDGDRKEALNAVRNVWYEVAKEYIGVPRETDIYYIDDFLADSLTGTRNSMKLVMTFMVLAILISALGLFAMSVYYTDQQARQIALRKIFGSDVASAVWRLSSSFLWMAAAAVVIAAPLCYIAIRYYLSEFYNAIAIPLWVIPAAAALTFLVAFVSIISRTWHSASENPVDTLKQD